MAISSTAPQTLGAALQVAGIVDLADLSVDGVTLGTQAYVTGEDSYFKLAVSSATVNHTDVEAVLGNDGVRWLLVTSGGGDVDSVVAGAGISVDSADPTAPVVSLLTPDTWVLNAKAAALAFSNTLTGLRYMKMSETPMGLASGSLPSPLGTVEGGTATGGASGLFYSMPIYQTPKTSTWFARFAVKYPAQAASVVAVVGLSNSSNTDYVHFGVVNPSNATKFVLTMSHSSVATVVATAGNADTAVHNVDFKMNGTTFKVDLDGVEVISTSTLTNFPTLPVMLTCVSGTGFPQWGKCLYAYVDPFPT